MSNQLGLPKGMRDFSPREMMGRNYIFDSIKKVFVNYGYEQIETPSMENRETLTGKYGEEGDRLIFNVLNSGDYLKKVHKKQLNSENLSQLTPLISEKALRYDLTVPFARYVVQHQNEITFPFKRFQIQPVWRADRPQKGRYREFYQCDADVVGSDSLLNEVELIKIFDEVLFNLGIQKVIIKVNNRKILSGIAEIIGRPDKIVDITVAIDKLDKIGLEKVQEELLNRGITNDELQLLQPLFELEGDNKELLQQLKVILATSEVGMKGIEELEYLFEYLPFFSIKNSRIQVDVTLARGLNYYTGAIFEVIAEEVNIGSICGGGRYDDLTGIFGLKGVSGVGISFGADRIYDVLESLDLFPSYYYTGTKVLFINFGKDEEAYSIPLLQKLRDEGIAAEIFPEAAKLKKQMKYADQKQIPFIIMVGEKEMNTGRLSFKNMKSGEQEELDFTSIKEKLKSF